MKFSEIILILVVVCAAAYGFNKLVADTDLVHASLTSSSEEIMNCPNGEIGGLSCLEAHIPAPASESAR